MRTGLVLLVLTSAGALARIARADGMGSMGTSGMSGMNCVSCSPQLAGPLLGIWDGTSHGVSASVAPLPPKVLLAAITFGATRFHTSYATQCPDLGPDCAGVTPPTPYRTDAAVVDMSAQLNAMLGVLDWLSLSMTIPWRSSVVGVSYTDLQGRPYARPVPDIHNRDETVSGLGDPTIAAVVGMRTPRFGFSIQGGALLPLGRTLGEDPFEAGREGRVHEHIQFGVGTVRPLLGSSLAYDLTDAVGIDGWFLAVAGVSENAIGYRPGDYLDVGARATSSFGTRSWRFGLGGELAHQTTETWHGRQETSGNLGRSDVLALSTVQWFPATGWALFGALRVPLYTHAVGMELSYPLTLQLGLATVLDFRPAPPPRPVIARSSTRTPSPTLAESGEGP